MGQKNWDVTWGFLKSPREEHEGEEQDQMPKNIDKMLKGENNEEVSEVPASFKQRLDKMKPPKERFAHPVTTQQEVGWHKPIECFGVSQHGRKRANELWAEKNPDQHRF